MPDFSIFVMRGDLRVEGPEKRGVSRRYHVDTVGKVLKSANLYQYGFNSPLKYIDPWGLESYADDGEWFGPGPYGSLFLGIGLEGSAHYGLFGLSGHIGVIAGDDGVRRGYTTVCVRLGPGIHVGGGIEGLLGGSTEGTCDIEGPSVGIGVDAGWGMGFGLGGISLGNTSGSLSGTFGGGWGISAGLDLCWTF